MKVKIILLILIFLCSCDHFKSNSSSDKTNSKVKVENGISEMHSFKNENFAPPPPPPGVDVNETKLVKTGSLKIVSDDIESVKNQLNNILKICNGTIQYESLSNYEKSTYYSLIYHVPANNFERFIQLLDSLKLTITEKSYRVSDITPNYIDETSRLNNKRKLEIIYLELLKKAKTVSEILEIQSKVEEIRSDIESKEEQIKYMDRQVAFSVLDIKIEQLKVINENEVTPKSSHSKIFSKAFTKGFEGIITSIAFLISIWPIYIILSIVIILLSIYKEKLKKAFYFRNKMKKGSDETQS